MFVRKKINPSGVVSVQVVDKSTGKYKMLTTIGSSSDPLVINQLVIEGEQWIKSKLGQFEIDFTDEKLIANQFLNSIEQVTVQGTELLLGKIFDDVGFSAIPDLLFKQLVIARLSFPVSKLKTTDFLSKYQFFSIDVQQVYRYLDKLHKTQKEKVQEISFNHSCSILGGKVSIVFYDVTTLYFEIDYEDKSEKRGSAKKVNIKILKLS